MKTTVPIYLPSWRTEDFLNESPPIVVCLALYATKVSKIPILKFCANNVLFQSLVTSDLISTKSNKLLITSFRRGGNYSRAVQDWPSSRYLVNKLHTHTHRHTYTCTNTQTQWQPHNVSFFKPRKTTSICLITQWAFCPSTVPVLVLVIVLSLSSSNGGYHANLGERRGCG